MELEIDGLGRQRQDLTLASRGLVGLVGIRP